MINATTPFPDPDNPSVNVTIDSNSSSGQSDKINKLLRFAGNAAEIYFPAGTYYLDGPLFRNGSSNTFTSSKHFLIVGDGPGATTFKLVTSGGTFNNPIFEMSGTPGIGGTSANHFQFRELTFDGSGRAIIWFKLTACANCRFERLEFKDIAESAIYGQQWWDSLIHDVVFDNCGASGKPVVSLNPVAGEDTNYSACNNLKFVASRWKNSQGIGCLLQNSKVIYFLGSSWQDAATTDVKLDTAYIASLSGCRFTNNTASQHINALNSFGLLVTTSSLDGTGAGVAAIRLDGSTQCVIQGNNFAKGPTGTPTIGSAVAYVNGSSTSNNVVANNAV